MTYRLKVLSVVNGYQIGLNNNIAITASTFKIIYCLIYWFCCLPKHVKKPVKFFKNIQDEIKFNYKSNLMYQ